jgi:hypothetical protein
MGTDPLSWIKDSREAERESSTQSVLSKQDVHPQQRKGGTRRHQRAITTASQEGLPDGWIRATFIVQEKHLAKIKALAYWERKQIKEIMTEALSAYLADRNVEPIPER